jgi:hypothetical protein
VAAVPAIHWINRPTFQQVVQTGSTDAFACQASRGDIADNLTLAIDGELGATVVALSKAKHVCGIADVDGAGVINDGAHLACYKAKTISGQPPHRPASGTLASAFATGPVKLSSLSSVCVGAEVDGDISSTMTDSRECFRARLNGADASPATVTVIDDNGERQSEIVKLDSVCLPVSTPAGAIRDSSSELACFRTRRARGEESFEDREVIVVSELGTETRMLVKDDRLCVPARISIDAPE